MQVKLGSDLRGMQKKDATANDFYSDNVVSSSAPNGNISEGALRALVVGQDQASSTSSSSSSSSLAAASSSSTSSFSSSSTAAAAAAASEGSGKESGDGAFNLKQLDSARRNTKGILRKVTIAKLRTGAYFNAMALKKHHKLHKNLRTSALLRRSETIKDDAFLFTHWLGAVHRRKHEAEEYLKDKQGAKRTKVTPSSGGKTRKVAPATAIEDPVKPTTRENTSLSCRNWVRASCHQCLGSTNKCMIKARKAGLVPVLTVTCWITVGTIVYHFVSGFYWSQAFFYAIDAGFSIGFGLFAEGQFDETVLTIPHNACVEAGLCASDSNETFTGTLRSACMQMEVDTNEWSMVYTMLHVMFGASLVATALTVMLIHTLDRTTYTPEDLVEREIEMKKQQRVAHAEAVKEVAGLSDADLKAKLVEAGATSSEVVNRANMERKWAQMRRHAAMRTQQEGEAQRRRVRSCKCVVTRHTCRNLVATQLFKTSIILFFWITGGVCYGVYSEGWPILDSLYFAITSLSTAGLKGPTHHFNGLEANCTNAADGECQTFPMVFVGLFCFAGVPLFAMVLGSIANFQIDQLMELRVQKRIERNIEVTEFEFANSLAGGTRDDMMEYVEFLQISLLRSGLVDQRRLDAIRNQFDVLDINSDQKVSRLEVAAMAIFNKFDVNSSGNIDFLEYLLCVDSLNEFFPELVNTYDDEMLEDVFMKVALIEVGLDGTCQIPSKDFQVSPYTQDELAKARISRLQFMVWCKDKISAATRKLKLTDVAHDTASENAASEVETKQDSANHTKLSAIDEH